MNTVFNPSCQSWPSAVWALALVAIAFFFFRYLTSTAQQRFQAKEARAVRDEARASQVREDRLRSEERSAAINAERRKNEREDDLREEEEKKARFSALREEARADPAANAACAEQCIRILSEADGLLSKICLYYTACNEKIDPDEDEPDDPYVNLGDRASSISESYNNALEYLQESQDLVGEGLYFAAKGQAEACLIEAKYATERLTILDTKQWNEIQTAAR